LRKTFVEEFYYALDDGESTNIDSTCANSRDCEDDSVMTKCCVNIVMTIGNSTDQLNRCMAEEIVSANWDWTMSTDTDKDDEEMTIAMKCVDSSYASYFSRFGIMAAALALLISTSV
jgi:hypothetical protein